MLALAGGARREPPGFRVFRAFRHMRANRIVLHELRVDFRIARFLNRSDYEKLL
jgi:hypothetical protein